MKDYYKILGVSRDASQDEIKKAYRALALQHHPDKNNGDTASEERFKEISESYIILGDVPKRNAYDYAQDNRSHHSGRSTSEPGQATPVTFLTLFKRIKAKVLNAGGQINELRLFTVINDLLSDDTIKLLIKSNDLVTNNLIVDEILVSCVFLPYDPCQAVHKKLLKLANGDQRFIEKIAVLKEKKSVRPDPTQQVTTAKSEAGRPVFFLILLLITLIVLALL